MVGLVFITAESRAQELVIQSLAGNGVLTWTNAVVEGTGFRVEWAPTVESSWQSGWETLLDIPATNAVTQRAVPMFYRVVSYPLPTQVISNVTAAVAFSILTNRFNDPGFIVLDVRTPSEYSSGHVKTAFNVNFYYASFQQTLAKLDRKLTYLVYCGSGSRSTQAATVMRQLQFMTVYYMPTGYGYSTLAAQPGASAYVEQ